MRRDDTLRIGPAVPGAVLPLLLIIVAVTAGLALQAPIGWAVASGTAAALSGFARMAAGPWLAVAILVVMLVAAEPTLWHTAVVILAVHLLHVMGSLALVVPLRSRIALRALRPTAIRLVLVEIVAQAVGAGATLLPVIGGFPIAGLVAAAAVLVLAVGGVRMLAQRRPEGFAVPRRPVPASARRADVGSPS
ncbi:hypothetical protein [Microbacterium sp.]|uniref:hypothetical protein n=1 Tax=Microbacterium sp. TaxID=51671 RepID=UPI003C786BB5